MTPEPLWKKVQRRHNRNEGGSGRTAYRYEEGADSMHSRDPMFPKHLVIESKTRTKIPKWIKQGLQQAVISATSMQIPLLRIHEKDKLYDNDLIVMRYRDWKDWYGEIDPHSESK